MCKKETEEKIIFWKKKFKNVIQKLNEKLSFGMHLEIILLRDECDSEFAELRAVRSSRVNRLRLRPYIIVYVYTASNSDVVTLIIITTI